MASYKDVGRSAMLDRHSVFKTHSIPPAAYFGPGIPSGVIPEFSLGDVCSRGLWDEAVDEPVAYPFVADKSGFCYIPNYGNPNISHQTGPEMVTPPLAAVDTKKPRLPNGSPCGLACRWSE